MKDDTSLQHYGVIGMKWGIRRARNKQAKENYKKAISNNVDKKDAKKSYKLEKKNKSNDTKIANRLYSKNSKAMNARIAKMDIGEAFLKTYVLGSYGTMKYEKARSEGSGVASSAGKAVLKNAGNVYALGIPSLVEYMQNRRARKK